MALAPGTRLGPYEILGLLGVGGMGEVYRAHDTRLERTVAIKILPAQFCLGPAWSPDGQRVAYSGLKGSTQAISLEASGANFGYARVSPDGKWIAYRTDESGTDEIYVSSFPNVAGRLQVSVAGGSMPCWRGDGKELYYLAPDNKLMAAEMKEANGLLQVVATKTLFQTAAAPTRTGGSPYDVTPDGKRFLVDTQTSDQTSALLSLVENWTGELKK